MPPRRCSARVGALVVLAAAAAWTGCGDETGRSRQDASPKVQEDPYSSRLDALHRQQGAAVQAEIVACMRRAGYKYEAVALPVDPRSKLSERERLRRYGYGANTARVAAGPPDPNARHVATLDPASRRGYRRALWGAAPKRRVGARRSGAGCRGASHRRHLGELTPILERFRRGREEMFGRLARDPRIETATAAWSRCMAGAGYRFSSPGQIYDYVYARAARPSPSRARARRQELRIAAADQACRDRHVSTTHERVVRDYLAARAATERRLLAEARSAAARSRR